MFPFERMTPREVDKLYEYARALYEGLVKPPEGITELGDTVEAVIQQMIALRLALRVPDHNSVDAVRKVFLVVNPLYYEAAMAYVEKPRYLN